MKPFQTILLSALLLLVLCIPALAGENEPSVCGDYEYALDADGGAVITAYTGKDSLLLIPSVLDSHPVTGLSRDTFAYSGGMTAVVLPNSLVSIEGNPFSECPALDAVILSPAHPALRVIDGVLFDRSGETLICRPRALTGGEYTVPESVTVIGERAFFACGQLSGVALPDGLTAIGKEAFCACEGVTALDLPASLTAVGPHAFSATGLAAVVLPDSVTELGESAFSFCRNLSQVTLSASLAVLPDWTFSGCAALSELVIPEGVTTVGEDAFYLCESLSRVTVPASVTSIDDNAFANTWGFKLIVQPDSFAEQFAKKRHYDYGRE